MRTRTATASAGATILALALMVTGCSGQLTPQPTTTVTTTVTASPSASPTASSSPTSTPSPTSTSGAQVDPNAPAGQCADKALSVAVTPSAGGAGAGSLYLDVAFTNTGSTSCALRGDPGVSVVGQGNGTQLGSAAVQNGSGSVETLTLAPGGTVSAQLQQVDIGSDGGPLAGKCTVGAADGYRVYPPHSFTAFFVAVSGLKACTNAVDWMTVGPVANR